MAEGSHPFPFRTRKLSPPAPMVLSLARGWESRSLPGFFYLCIIETMKRRKRENRKVLLFSYFISLILIGSFLLSIPEAWNGDGNLKYIDALFTSTSAVCVTGLITVQTADYSFFGKLVILLLIQFGGLGIISFTTLFIAIPSRRLSLSSRQNVQEYYLGSLETDPLRIIKQIVIMTLIFEMLGFLFLLKPFSNYNGESVIFNAVFHSVSAFCNAGFSLFRDSLVHYRDSLRVNITVMLLIIFGGLGFLVIRDILERITGKKKSLMIHTRIVLIMTVILIFVGASLYYIFEIRNSIASYGNGEKIIASFFQAVTTRTAGFNTIEQNNLSIPSKVITLLLMFIGGGSGSIAGGIKVTTFFLVILTAIHETDSKNEIAIFNRKIPSKTLTRAMSFTLKAIMILFTSILFLTITEHIHVGAFSGKVPQKSFLSIVFESFSAFGTVGLSMGITPYLTRLGKVVIILTMFAGRVGLISIAMPKFKKYSEHLVDYPKGEVLIG